MALIIYHDRMEPQCIAAARWLLEHTRLDADQRRALASLAPDLTRRLGDASPALVGIAGPPGSGKSTLAQMMKAVLNARGRKSIVLALDDYYLGAAARRELARLEHPLFSIRGAPGTHDFDLLLEHLSVLRNNAATTLELPRFDKSRDDREKEPVRLTLTGQPEVVFVEGWLIGMPPQSAADLEQPVNSFEQEQDPDGRWRSAVNNHLARYHDGLEPLLDQAWLLRAPDWKCVIDWRWRQARENPAGHSGLESRQAVAEFLAHFQRLVLHGQKSAAQWPDLVIHLDRGHLPHLESSTPSS